MYDMYWEACFHQKNVYDYAKCRFATTSMSGKDSP